MLKSPLCLRTLELVAGGDKRKAAALLGLGLSSLYRKIEELDIKNNS